MNARHLIASACVLLCASAGAQSLRFDLPAQPLEAALRSFELQSGRKVQAEAGLLRDRRSSAVAASMEPAEALSQLLQATGLRAVAQGAGWRLEASDAGGAAQTLSTIRVAARAGPESATGPVDGYVATRSASGTKTDTPIIETPQSVSVVTADEIETLRPQSLIDALGYTAGVSRSADGGGADRTSDSFVIRGFRLFAGSGNFLRDGMQVSANVYNGQQEPYGLERIEVLKGAASVLYGTSAPGGVVNTVTKRPTAESLHEINLDFGSFDRKQFSGDFAGKLSEDGVWTYRLTALARDSGSFIDHVPDDRTYLAPALKWQPDADTSLTLLASYQHYKTAYVYALPGAVTVDAGSNPNGRVDSRLFTGTPDFDRNEGVNTTLGYFFEHAFTPGLKLRHAVRQYDAKYDFDFTWLGALDADQRTIGRGAQSRHEHSRVLTSDTSLEWKPVAGPVAHTVLVGLDYAKERHGAERYDRGEVPSLDLYAPVYGPVDGPFTPLAYSWKQRGTATGLYAQDQMKIADRWVLLFGGRQDWTRYGESPFFGEESYVDDRTNAFTGRAGVVYLAGDGVAPFVSFSQSFEPTAGHDRLGQRFKPTRGEQYEAGLRWQPPGRETMLSATVYQLSQTNVLTADPADPLNYSVQTGEVRSRGFEFEANTRIGRHAKLIAAYAYTDARVSKSNDSAEIGRRSANVPYQQLSLWGESDFGAFGLPGLKAGLGARYVGETVNQSGAERVPAYTVFDAIVGYASGPWRYALNFSNLADKQYIVACTYDCFFGERRRVIASATYRW